MGLSLSLSPSLISMLTSSNVLQASLSFPLSLKHFFLHPPSPPLPPSQLRKNNSRPSCVQRVRGAHLSCLAVLPNCLASRQLTLEVAASLVGEILSFHKSQFQFSRNRIKMGRTRLTTCFFVQFCAGSIPESFGNLRNLECLYLYNNQLSGPFFSFFGMVSAD